MNRFAILLLITISTLAVCLPARSQTKVFGMGVIVGEPTGLSLKGWLSKRTAWDAGVAWSFSKGTSLHLHADYLIHSFSEIEDQPRMPVYYGIGGRIKTSSKEDGRIGVRGVIGLEYLFRELPMDVFVEFAPILDLAPATELGMNAGLGMRYFFD